MMVLVTSFHILFWGSCPTGSTDIYFTSDFIGPCVRLIGFNTFGCLGNISCPIRRLRCIGYLVDNLKSISAFIDSTNRGNACSGYSGGKRSDYGSHIQDYPYSINYRSAYIPVFYVCREALHTGNQAGDLYGRFPNIPIWINPVHRIPCAIRIRAQGVILFRQRIGAREDSRGGLEAGEAVVPVYSKELLQFLAGVKIVRFFMNCNWIGRVLAHFSVRKVVELLDD